MSKTYSIDLKKWQEIKFNSSQDYFVSEQIYQKIAEESSVQLQSIKAVNTDSAELNLYLEKLKFHYRHGIREANISEEKSKDAEVVKGNLIRYFKLTEDKHIEPKSFDLYEDENDAYIENTFQSSYESFDENLIPEIDQVKIDYEGVETEDIQDMIERRDESYYSDYSESFYDLHFEENFDEKTKDKNDEHFNQNKFKETDLDSIEQIETNKDLTLKIFTHNYRESLAIGRKISKLEEMINSSASNEILIKKDSESSHVFLSTNNLNIVRFIRSGFVYTQEEKDFIKDAFKNWYSIETISKHLYRTPSAIESYLQKEGFLFPVRHFRQRKDSRDNFEFLLDKGILVKEKTFTAREEEKFRSKERTDSGWKMVRVLLNLEKTDFRFKSIKYLFEGESTSDDISFSLDDYLNSDPELSKPKISPNDPLPMVEESPTAWETYCAGETCDWTNIDKLKIANLLIFEEKISHFGGSFNLLFNLLMELKFYSVAMIIAMQVNDYWNFHIAGIYNGIFVGLPKQSYVERLKSLNLSTSW